MKKNKVLFYTQTKVTHIENDLVHISGPLGEKSVETDSIIMTLFKPEESWRRETQGFIKELYFIGDAKKPRRLNNAIHDGYRLGMVL
jgi:2,4-dienoyl-CoA reductase (NADPH2)